ncbi:permease prefix domain 1-containing protein [Fusibacter ferrireducens]|uniref:FtsW/RodA/SpoVE family cell cycle protein n=1 Tax=Fusibacter ferrireducens TaxID=2785058 RepID=A0ABR9ZZH6_9FIRM|nr:permease prefix domain 1-containing protein [Fusibacter ferrireducens]MBF4695781.1 FtsW/RodA/SpoVE family cell cycle protein [Fusibacter ferrireducens]
MQPFEKIREYSRLVCSQIRWEGAREPISKEIENHIMDQRDAYIADGVDETEAIEHALCQMGDPVVIGTQLDRTHRPKAQWGMLLLTMTMVMMGVLIRIFLLSDPLSTSLSRKELISIIIGALCMLTAYFSDFTLIGKYPKFIFAGIVGLSIVVLNTSPMLNGRIYYAASLPLLFQIGFVGILYNAKNKGYLGLFQCGLAFGIMGYITMKIPSLSGLLIFTFTCMVTLFIAIHREWFKVKKQFAYMISFALVSWPFLLIGVINFRSIILRFQMALGNGYIGTNVKQLIMSSRWIGHGYLPPVESTEVFRIPNIDTDFMFTYLIYNYGWLVFIGIVGLIGFFIIKGFKCVVNQKSSLGLLVSLSIMLTYTTQVFWYILWNLGFQGGSPFTLPLLAKGNIALIVNLALIGIMLSVFRTGDIVKDNVQKFSPIEQFISFEEGKLVIDFKRK